ncbi:hypothetical protein L0F63_004854 [Massospora cicadina]|nr:hypothetical protein L0F63_004854 [Massospora cicadina]
MSQVPQLSQGLHRGIRFLLPIRDLFLVQPKKLGFQTYSTHDRAVNFVMHHAHVCLKVCVAL